MFSYFYKNLFLLLLVMTSVNLAMAKNDIITEDPATGTVKGKVLSSDKQPLTGVTVGLKDTRYLTATDNNGNFRLKAPGG